MGSAEKDMGPGLDPLVVAVSNVQPAAIEEQPRLEARCRKRAWPAGARRRAEVSPNVAFHSKCVIQVPGDGSIEAVHWETGRRPEAGVHVVDADLPRVKIEGGGPCRSGCGRRRADGRWRCGIILRRGREGKPQQGPAQSQSLSHLITLLVSQAPTYTPSLLANNAATVYANPTTVFQPVNRGRTPGKRALEARLGRFAAAFLVFLSGAAEAGIVAADLGAGAHGPRRRGTADIVSRVVH